MARRKYNVVSLFSGAMGLDIGLEQTDRFHLVAAVEKQRAFCDTIRANQRAGRLAPGLEVFEADITNVDPAELLKRVGLQPGEVDLLTGGPPCQSFSTAGRRQSTQDPRGTMLWHYLRFVEALRPRFFLMENVRGLVSAALLHRPIAERPDKGGPPLKPEEEPGSVVRLFAEDLQKIPGAAYHMDCFEVNAVNYGTPQLRERALFIGNRYNDELNFPDPTHGPPNGRQKQQGTLFSETQEPLPAWRTLGDALEGLEDPGQVIMNFSPRKLRYLAKVRSGSNWRSLSVEDQQRSMGRAWHAKGGRSGWWRRLSFDLPCPTLVTMPNHASTSLCHPSEVRALTLREYARIQEFPDAWKFGGTPAEQYAQAGNAVPVRLGRVAGNVIGDHLDRLDGRDWKPYREKPETYRIIYVQAHVRTRQWFRAGKTLVWKDGETNNRASYAPPKTGRKTSTL